MTAEEILELIMRAPTSEPPPTNEVLVTLWATRLAELSGRLTEDELFPLIALGAAVFQCGYREFESGITADLLLKQLRKGA